MQNDLIDLSKLKDLENYRFDIVIDNKKISYQFDDEADAIEISNNELANIFEYGSALHNIPATRFISNALMIMDNELNKVYGQCLEILLDGGSNDKILFLLRDFANKLTARIRMNAPQELKWKIKCRLFYKNHKIN